MEMRQPKPFEGDLIEKIDEAADRLLFLSDVSQVLSRALTDTECFDHLLELVVPKFADWATLTIIDEQGVLGALWLATSDSGRIFTQEDLKMAEEIAARAGYFAYHLIQYTVATQKFEKLKIECLVREQLISQLRHDVRSILSAALLSAQMIERSDASKKDTYARRIVTSIQRASEVLEKTKESANTDDPSS